jgi:hypothetical protein
MEASLGFRQSVDEEQPLHGRQIMNFGRRSGRAAIFYSQSACLKNSQDIENTEDTFMGLEMSRITEFGLAISRAVNDRIIANALSDTRSVPINVEFP